MIKTPDRHLLVISKVSAMERFSETTLGYLTRAGWYPGRSIDISEIEGAMSGIGLEVFPAAQAFWREFDGLAYAYPYGPNAGGGVGFYALDIADRTVAKEIGRYISEVNKPLCPIGEMAGDVEIFLIDPDGWIYGVVEGIGLYCYSPDEFFENLPKGRNAKWVRSPKTPSLLTRILQFLAFLIFVLLVLVLLFRPIP